MTEQTATIGHNRGPVIAPSDADVLADLQRRYPDLDVKLGEFEKSLAGFPTSFTLADEDQAAALQDLIGQMKDQKSAWAGVRKNQKKPWDTIVKVVQNFFTKGEDKIDGWIAEWKPRHQQFLDLKEADSRRRAEEQAAAQKAEADRLAREAEAAEERKRKAEEEERQAKAREEESRRQAEEAEQRKREAEEAAERAKEEERRLAAEKRDRERAEKETNTTNLREVRRLMKEAEKLHLLGEAEEAEESEIQQLDALIRPGGSIGAYAGPVAASQLLDEEQKLEIETVRGRLNDMRREFNERLGKREAKKREKAAREAEEREAKAAAERAERKAKEDAEYEAAKAKRAEEEARAAAAKEEQKRHEEQVRAERSAQRDAAGEQKDAARDARRLSTDADRADNRAGRLERKLENSTDADHSRTRGDLGTVASISGRWAYFIEDEEALRKVCGPLGPHFMIAAIEGACSRWMAAHREGFTGERVTDPALPGVVFAWERESRIA